MNKIDKNIVKKNFSEALDYDKFTSYHNLTLEMAVKSVKKYAKDFFGKENGIGEASAVKSLDILDAGCGTGELYVLLNKAFKNGEIKINYFGFDFAGGLLSLAKQKINKICKNNKNTALLICADAESLPFQEKKFDIILSNMTLHWLSDIGIFFNLSKVILKNEGIIIVSFLIEGTLRELYGSLMNICISNGMKFEFLHFPKIKLIYDKVRNSGFNVLESKVFEYIEKGKSSMELLKKINEIGAKSPLNDRNISVSLLRRLLRNYDKSFTDGEGYVTATYKIIYMVLEKTA